MLPPVLRRAFVSMLALLVATGAALDVWRHAPARVPIASRPPAAAADARATNVVLVIGCTARANQTTPYGAPTHVSPFLDALAREGTRFAFAIAQAPWTRPAVTTLLTSRHATASECIPHAVHQPPPLRPAPFQHST